MAHSWATRVSVFLTVSSSRQLCHESCSSRVFTISYCSSGSLQQVQLNALLCVARSIVCGTSYSYPIRSSRSYLIDVNSEDSDGTVEALSVSLAVDSAQVTGAVRDSIAKTLGVIHSLLTMHPVPDGGPMTLH